MNDRPLRSGIERIIEIRRLDRRFDEDLWGFAGEVIGRNLQNLSDSLLQDRLNSIDKNIQFLDDGKTPRDGLPKERGWLSPWWWFQIRHWTLAEFKARGLIPDPTPSIPERPSIHPDLRGVMLGGRRILVRLNELRWLYPMLEKGRFRFRPASYYRKEALGTARQDNELAKPIFWPGHKISVTHADGTPLSILGDLTKSFRRAFETEEDLIDLDYWLCSFSSELDPRAFTEFPNYDGCIVIHDPMAFVTQALPHLNKIMPTARKELFNVGYYDPYYPPRHVFPLRDKVMPYAYQQEMRLILDTQELGPASQEYVDIEIGPITHIAGIYSGDGRRIAGVGPENFLL